MPNPSASSKTKLAAFKFFWPRSIYLKVVKYFWPCSNMQIYKVKYHFWPRSKKFERVQKYLTQSKKFEHGQNIFELADGVGKRLTLRVANNLISILSLSSMTLL